MKEGQPQISVIIPAYNAENTISGSVSSVLAQRFSDFELLIINDGSTDSTENICRNLADSDKRIRLFSNTNHGANYSRKSGVENANGKFVTFLDADDTLRNEALSFFILEIGDCDILISRTKYGTTLRKEEYLDLLMRDSLPRELWGKLYRRELFSEWIMDVPRELYIGEDLLWNIRIASTAHTYKLVSENFYDYDESNNGSLMHQHKKNLAYEQSFYEAVCSSITNIGLEDSLQEQLFACFRLYAFMACVREIEPLDTKDEFVKQLGKPSPLFKGKVNPVVNSIMQIPFLNAKIHFLRGYFNFQKAWMKK